MGWHECLFYENLIIFLLEELDFFLALWLYHRLVFIKARTTCSGVYQIPTKQGRGGLI